MIEGIVAGVENIVGKFENKRFVALRERPREPGSLRAQCAVAARFKWSLFARCPHCLELFDLSAFDAGGRFSDPIFEGRFSDLEGAAVDCPECRGAFVLGEIILD